MTTVKRDLEEVSFGVACSLCTFPDTYAAAREFARILRPGGLAGITDVAITDAGLPAELTTLATWVACIADARSLADYTGILASAGLHLRHTQAHHDGLLTRIERIDARITALRIAAPQLLADNGIQPDTATNVVKAGRIGCTLMTAEKT
ncbi:hypothetical protein A9W97_02405 [Mycobacterium gordonae]|nr:hypothetical protein [Mycobacterium gordonae]OBJ81394.1 hypothetical protein A9W97_02405 [Mycobacterium gordonae]